MATRIYLPPSSSAPAISPTQSASWEAGTGSFTRVRASTTKSGTAHATSTLNDTSGSSGRDHIHRQFIMPLTTGAAFATTDTLTGFIMGKEDAENENLFSTLIVRVIGSDGSTVRATLYAGETSLTSEWPSSSLQAQACPQASRALAANYTSVAGDYLVIEVGCRQGSSQNVFSSMRWGDSSGTDHSAAGSTSDFNTWVQFSNTFTEDTGGGGESPDRYRSIMMIG
jgi:hypothetical protein